MIDKNSAWGAACVQIPCCNWIQLSTSEANDNNKKKETTNIGITLISVFQILIPIQYWIWAVYLESGVTLFFFAITRYLKARISNKFENKNI